MDKVSVVHSACIQGHVACAKLLMENGANVKACASGHVTCVLLLLQHGATPVGISECSSPIHRAAAKGPLQCIEHPVQYGADVDQQTSQSGSPISADMNSSVFGDSTLPVAAHLSSPELVSVLLDHEANRYLRTLEGKQVEDLAPPNSMVQRLLT
ncbi:hypothetical protein Q8A73_009953 [Channa argus]|nr:hypothetical protein Q8A73_009953 [Channa argus]